MMNHALKTKKPCVHITPAITGEKARSGFESSTEGAMVDGDVMHLLHFGKTHKLHHPTTLACKTPDPLHFLHNFQS